jgi:fatty acid desaturase
MRPRDARAIVFCTVTIVGLAALSFALSQSYVVALGLTVAYAAFILTRPRMLRVYRRLRGEPDWGGYFKDD